MIISFELILESYNRLRFKLFIKIGNLNLSSQPLGEDYQKHIKCQNSSMFENCLNVITLIVLFSSDKCNLIKDKKSWSMSFSRLWSWLWFLYNFPCLQESFWLFPSLVQSVPRAFIGNREERGETGDTRDGLVYRRDIHGPCKMPFQPRI